jgi:hypothetical protein
VRKRRELRYVTAQISFFGQFLLHALLSALAPSLDDLLRTRHSSG